MQKLIKNINLLLLSNQKKDNKKTHLYGVVEKKEPYGCAAYWRRQCCV